MCLLSVIVERWWGWGDHESVTPWVVTLGNNALLHIRITYMAVKVVIQGVECRYCRISPLEYHCYQKFEEIQFRYYRNRNRKKFRVAKASEFVSEFGTEIIVQGSYSRYRCRLVLKLKFPKRSINAPKWGQLEIQSHDNALQIEKHALSNERMLNVN